MFINFICITCIDDCSDVAYIFFNFLLFLIVVGFELSFFSGVYGTGIGFTKRLGSDAAKYVGISGICIGIGEITG